MLHVDALSVGDILEIDYLGPFPESDNHRYIFVVVDKLSRYVELHPTKSCTAVEAAKGLLHTFAHLGICKTLQSDRGSHFINEIFDLLVTNYKITKSTSLSYRPQSNGSVERKNRDIIDALRTTCSESSSWSLTLNWL